MHTMLKSNVAFLLIVLKLTLKYVLSSGQKFRKCIEITDSCYRWKTVMQDNQC